MGHRLSVVVPTYNEEDTIGRCLEALRRQGGGVEIIVVDGVSTDSTVSIAEEWADKVLVSEKADSPAAARNMGAREASGDLVAFVDADTVVSRGWARAVVETLGNNEVVGVTGPVLPLPPTNFWEMLGHVLTYDTFVRLTILAGRPHLLGLNVAYRREVFLRLGGFPLLKLSEDVVFSSVAGKLGRVVFNKDMLVYTSPRRLRKMGAGWSAYYLIFNGLKTILGLRPETYYPKIR